MKNVIIIGGGAAGMTCAVALARSGVSVTILERGERLGRKLAATGNGQGNVTNTAMGAEHYFSDDANKVAAALERFSERDAVRFLESMGGIFLADARGRVYPAGRQASAVTDLFRRELNMLGVEICFNARVERISNAGDGFMAEWNNGKRRADALVLAAGGKAAPSFGTDGTAYALVSSYGHFPAELSPSLVRLTVEPAAVRGLKGIRTDSLLKIERNGKTVYEVRGDVLFSENGISGDAVFRASAYAEAGDRAVIDFLPDVKGERVREAIEHGGLYCVVNNGLGRFLQKRAKDSRALAESVKRFSLTVTGTGGFSEAQATKGGIRLGEVDENLMSVFKNNLYFAGEILNVDGECGGYNLQWAFTSAHCVAEGILKRGRIC